MKIEILNERKNPHMKRKEILIKISHPGVSTPSTVVLQQYLSKEIGTNPEKIDIKNIFSEVGIGRSNSKIYIWEENKVADLSKKEEKPAEPSENTSVETPAPVEEKTETKTE
ncbi:MAG: hypothetical protein ABIA21_00535 [Candidatus Aenigmatarchaeota archaeon]